MSTLIQKAAILTIDGGHGTEPFEGDILIAGDAIAAIGTDLVAPPGSIVIDGRRRLVMPGLINSHFHSGEAFLRGRYGSTRPLELWMLNAYPVFVGPIISLRLLYLRSMVAAMESLKNGVTTICDDFIDRPAHDLDRLGTVFAAYEDAGIRVNVSHTVVNKSVLDTLANARDIVPAEIQALVSRPSVEVPAYVDYCRSVFASLHDRAGRLRFMIAPTAPQRCTDELLVACSDLARQNRVPFHTHVLETKTQAVTGQQLYGQTIVGHMRDLGILHSGTTLAHSIWVTSRDIEMLAEAGSSIVHNCISNQKLGAGVAPLRQMIDAGVNVALGTDGLSCSDSARMFDVIRPAALPHSFAGPGYSQWLQAREILQAATISGARSALIDHQVGSLKVGKKADLLVLNMNSINFTPLNDIRNHLVFSEDGTSIEHVMVNGEIVVRNGKLVRVDEAAILEEVRDSVPRYLAEQDKSEEKNRIFEKYFAEIHRRATAQDIGMNRYSRDAN